MASPISTPLIVVLNGPNLNLLGEREPDTYGATTLPQLDEHLVATGQRLGVRVVCHQSNHEGQLIDWVHQYRQEADGWIVNAAAYTHTSIALHDALRCVRAPVIEVHLTNIHQREAFRHQSYISPLAWGVICGLGPTGYEAALTAHAKRLSDAT
jgi:3-dehydroquinate dehydratase II